MTGTAAAAGTETMLNVETSLRVVQVAIITM
jgi:hypothetical protein